MSVAVVTTIAAIILPTAVVAMVSMLVLFVAALGSIAGFILGRSHEIHRPVAGVVLLAMLAPGLGMTRWHVQIDRLHRHRLSHHPRHGDYRLRVHERRRRPVTQHHVAIHAGNDFAGDRWADADILRL